MLGAVSGGLFAASFPPLDIGWLSLVALVPLFRALSGTSPRQAIAVGWVFGTVGCCACVSSSIFEASLRYFDHGPLLRTLFALVVPQISALPYIVLFALGARRLLGRGRGRAWVVLAIPALWTASEFARSTLDGGIPWLLLAHAMHDLPVLLQVADTTGACGVGFVVVTVNMLVLCLTSAERRAWRPIVICCAVVSAAVTYGTVQLRAWEGGGRPRLRVGMVQGAVPLDWRESVHHLGKSIERMGALTESISARSPHLVIWPENAVGFAVSANRSLLNRVTDSLPPSTGLLFGAPYPVSHQGRAEFRNSAFLLDDSGAVDRYDKQHLTPFAEYSPWPLRMFSDRRFGRADRYVPGSGPSLFDVGGSAFGVLICFESIYAGLANELVREGAEFLVNISNDDWFAGRPALSQHLYATLLRAVEARRSLVRVTNSGISVVIRPTGVVATRLPVGVPVADVVEIELVRQQSRYTRWGDLFAWGCVLFSVGAVMFADRRWR